MKRINEILLVLIFILTAVLAAAVGFRAYHLYDEDRRMAREQEEMEVAELFARNKEAQDRVRQMQDEIQQLAEDKEELKRFIAQIQNEEPAGYDTVSDNAPATEDDTVSENDTVSDNNAVSGDADVSGNGIISENSLVSGNSAVSENSLVSGNSTISENGLVSGSGTVSDNSLVSGNSALSENSLVSGNDAISQNGMVSANSSISDNEVISGNSTMSGNGLNDDSHYMTLAERRLLRTSLVETWRVNQEDRNRIAEGKTDFSGLKIACLGDSITAAANLESEENYQQYAYPARLKELLGAEEVYNLGIGGSSIGRYWADAYVDRYQEIPEDSDIILVMGGTNDGFCVSDKEFGNLDERAYRTFCGDLDELMRGLRERYPDADIFFVTPLPNVLHDYLMRERNYLLPQKNFVDVILTLAKEYDFEVIDLYNSNILDSHDADIVTNYIPDGVHANHEGYQMIAEHIAAELIRYYENAGEDETEWITTTDNTVMKN